MKFNNFKSPSVSSLSDFEAKAQSFDQEITPFEVEIEGVTWEAGGTHGGQAILSTEEGGQVRNSEIHFTIRKQRLEMVLDPDTGESTEQLVDYMTEPPSLTTLVSYQGEEFEITKVWGLEDYDTNFSFRAEVWNR